MAVDIDIDIFNHSIADIVPVLDALRFPHVFATGYVPLRCAWNPGCPAEIFPRTPISKGPPVRRAAEKNYADAWRAIFPDEPVPAVVGAPSSSHFAVTGERIRMRTLEEWERMRRWVLETKLEDDVSAKIVEHMWHVMMHMPSVYCPPASDCYCNTLGHCNITCSTGSCEGRYRLPPQTDVPEHWPREGGGKDGWPVPGWNESKGVGTSPDKNEEKDEEKGEKGEKGHPEDTKVTDDGRKSIPVAVQGEWKPQAQEKEEGEARKESDQ
ncbi:hypothetical protein KEM56_005317 [Ascosphaera pollenicola]|nr:hypothetical protein KEM56_005317 [Ascosphaera pollenicola]